MLKKHICYFVYKLFGWTIITFKLPRCQPVKVKKVPYVMQMETKDEFFIGDSFERWLKEDSPDLYQKLLQERESESSR